MYFKVQVQLLYYYHRCAGSFVVLSSLCWFISYVHSVLLLSSRYIGCSHCLCVRARNEHMRTTQQNSENTQKREQPAMPHSSQIDRIDRRKQRVFKAPMLKCTKQKARKRRNPKKQKPQAATDWTRRRTAVSSRSVSVHNEVN